MRNLRSRALSLFLAALLLSLTACIGRGAAIRCDSAG